MSKQKKGKTKVPKEPRNPPIMVTVRLSDKYNRYANPQDKSPEKKKEVYFQRMVDLFMLATIHGFKEGLRKPFGKSKKTDIFKWSNFKESDKLIIQAIALLAENTSGEDNAEIINSKAQMSRIIEEYANGGFQDVIEKLTESPDYEKNFMELLVRELETGS